ncbi:MAG: radical SAM protein [Dehalococcoidia bacterium]|nr:MAG: radical SAM protein [Dehalococcoidia bacterium]
MPTVTGSPKKSRKVLLVNPNRMKPPVAPIALDYLAHALRESRFNVDVLDLCFADDVQSEIDRYFASNEVIAIAVTLRNADDTFFVTQDFCIDKYRDLIDLIKAQSSAPIILGGSGFSIMPVDILNYYDVNLGIWGEGEHSLSLLLNIIATDDNLDDVPGLIYRINGELHITPADYLDLGRMSTPARDAVDNHRYFIEGAMGNIETKRGCPKDCIYCVDPVGKGSKLRLRSPKSVADEIESLLEMDIDHLHLCDSEFNIPEQHARDICKEIITRQLGDKLRWYTYATPAGFSRELASLMLKAGCVGINFGVDSGCDQILRSLGRDFTVEDLTKTADICREEGIILMYDLLIGGPGETRQTLKETIETMKRISPDRVGANLGVRIFPQTRLAQAVRGAGPLDTNPNLQGNITDNYSFFTPIYYISSDLGPDPNHYMADLIGEDQRFFFFSDTGGADKNYTYNDNTVLVNAINQGYRGAFWDILRRIGEAID